MEREQALTARVLAVRENPEAADRLARRYLPFIRSEADKCLRHPAGAAGTDLQGVALLAFHEAVLGYRRGRGPFLPYAAKRIGDRLVDAVREEQRRQNLAGTAGEARAAENPDARTEARRFAARLAEFGIPLTGAARDCPREDRLLLDCRRALDCARENGELLEELAAEKKLPAARLAAGAGVSRRMLERHGRYLTALLLLYAGEFPALRARMERAAGPGPYLVLECALSYAVVLDGQGRILKAANRSYRMGQTVEFVTPARDGEEADRAGRRRRLTVGLSLAAAACLLSIGGSWYFLAPYGTVRIRAGSEAVLAVNRLERVLSVSREGETPPAEHRLFWIPAADAAGEMAESAAAQGTLSPGGGVELAVESDHELWRTALERQLLADLARRLGPDIRVDLSAGTAARSTGTADGGGAETVDRDAVEAERTGSGEEQLPIPVPETPTLPVPPEEVPGPEGSGEIEGIPPIRPIMPIGRD